MPNMIEVHDGRMRVIPEPQYMSRISNIPNRVTLPKVNGLSFPATPFYAKRIFDALEGTPTVPDQGWLDLWALKRRVDHANENRGKVNPDFKYVTAPWLHQEQALNFVYNLNAAALYAHMGTGKTKMVIDLVRNKGYGRVLIVTLRRAATVWEDQFKIHAHPEEFTTHLLIDPMKRLERAEWLEFRPRSAVPDIFITNYDSAVPGSKKRVNPFTERLLEEEWDLIVLDESHKIKSASGVTSEFMEKAGRRAAQRIIATGTLMPHSPLDLFGQFRFLDSGIFGSMAEFQDRYIVFGGFENRQIKEWKNTDELAQRWGQITYEVGSDVLDLEEPTHTVIPINLNPTAFKTYKQLEKEMAADVGATLVQGYILVTNTLTQMLRAQQITSGSVPVSDPETDEATPQVIDTSKAEALSDLMESLDPTLPLVVYCKFYHDMEMARKVATALGRPYLELSGRRDDLRVWQNATGGEVLAVQMRAGGAGVDLTRARHAVYYSLDHSLGDYQQTLSRLHRPPQEHSVSFYYLLATKTIDVTIQKALINKQNVVEAVRDKMRELYLEVYT